MINIAVRSASELAVVSRVSARERVEAEVAIFGEEMKLAGAGIDKTFS